MAHCNTFITPSLPASLTITTPKFSRPVMYFFPLNKTHHHSHPLVPLFPPFLLLHLLLLFRISPPPLPPRVMTQRLPWDDYAHLVHRITCRRCLGQVRRGIHDKGQEWCGKWSEFTSFYPPFESVPSEEMYTEKRIVNMWNFFLFSLGELIFIPGHSFLFSFLKHFLFLNTQANPTPNKH